ncbi:MAG TPA: tetratricopeptide repeat protein [Xanthomonadaceae bacterium]|nr:tetratricopeptide repeat protein [Xanthomonadaceae bacterium]
MNDAWTLLQATRDEDIPLLEATLLIARDEYPDLEIDACQADIAQLSNAFRSSVAKAAGEIARMQALNVFLFEEHGFSGNQSDYYDPRNSYINDVLERRLGIPISLAVIQIAIARDAGLPLEGVSFPGHFLVRLPVDDGLIVLDPYQRGRSVDAEELRERAKPHMGDHRVGDRLLSEMLAPASHRQILQRMLRNLLGVYREREDLERALRCSDRLVTLDPTDFDSLRERGLLYLEVGHLRGAREDLHRYLAESPESADREQVRSALIERGAVAARLN